jgi:hypothetical protein
MHFVASARDSIMAAEAEIRRLAAEAMKVGAYDDVQTLADWARSLAEIYAPVQAVTVAETVQFADSAAATRKKRQSYPRFYRHEDSIVKVGWSKKERQEYEQKAPRTVIELLVERLKKAGATRGPVPTNKLLPLTSGDGAEIPSYQAYLVLRFLTEKGIVESRGRKGYTGKMGGGTPAALAESLWASLPSI